MHRIKFGEEAVACPWLVQLRQENKCRRSYEHLSKLLVSPLITPVVVPYIIPYITPFKEFRLWLIWGLQGDGASRLQCSFSSRAARPFLCVLLPLPPVLPLLGTTRTAQRRVIKQKQLHQRCENVAAAIQLLIPGLPLLGASGYFSPN